MLAESNVFLHEKLTFQWEGKCLQYQMANILYSEGFDIPKTQNLDIL